MALINCGVLVILTMLVEEKYLFVFGIYIQIYIGKMLH